MPSEPPHSSLVMRLDLSNACLWRGAQPIPLRPKTFAVLQCLLAHPGQLVTKAALLDTVWPETAVSDVVLMVCIRELRQALGDDSKAPRFIETVHRRGYRFIGDLPVTAPSPPAQLSTAGRTVPPVGREAEWVRLHACFAQALGGTRQVVFVTGEAGLGKTTLMEAFAAELDAHEPVWIGWGQCVEHYGAGEAYLPVLEALGRLCRGPGGKEVVRLLGQQAPTWLVQMPGLVRAADLETLRRHILGATRDRMLRELAEALDLLTAQQPLVLVLEDLHWSDPSTLDLLSVLARRREPARLLLLGTYRLPEVLHCGHPLQTVQQELHIHRHCMELSLTLLPEEAIAAYLATRFPGLRLVDRLARLVYQRTEGNPLFMVTLVESWLTQGLVLEQEDAWVLPAGIEALQDRVPDSLQQMIEMQLDRLSVAEQQILEAGSVAGIEFSAAAVAAGLAQEAEQVDDGCAALARRGQWLRAGGERTWPDETVAGSYHFVHTLYQEVFYRRVSVTRRVRLHRRIGARLEAGYGAQAGDIAAELAMHFERGQDTHQAVVYLQQAADTALQRCAYAEVITHLTKGLALLKTLPNTPERVQHELLLQTALGSALIATKGEASPDVEHAYARARELCRQVDDVPRLFTALWGLRLFYAVRGELHTARELGEQLLILAQRAQDPILLLGAHQGLGTVLFDDGEFLLGQAHLQQGITLSRQPQRVRTSLYIWDPGVVCHAFAALTLWFLGYPEQACQRGREALTLAQDLADPFSLASTLFWTALLSQCCRDVQEVSKRAEALVASATAHGFPHRVANGRVLYGWALSAQGHSAEALTQLHQGRAVYRATWAEQVPLHQLGLLAEAYGNARQADEGLRLLAEPWATDTKRGERYYEAELYRLKGELLLAQEGQGHKVKGNRQTLAEVETCFRQALAVARLQQAKSLELRAAVSLARLWQQCGAQARAQQVLADVYSWFTEGFDTKDLQEARALLEELPVHTTTSRKRHIVTEV